MDTARAYTLDEARAAKKRALEVFKPLASVVGVGVTRIGGGYGGVPVRIEVVGLPESLGGSS